MNTTDLAALIAELHAASKAHELAQQQTSMAQNSECTALNRVNDLQKQIDAELAKVRKTAPRESDWKRVELKGQE